MNKPNPKLTKRLDEIRAALQITPVYDLAANLQLLADRKELMRSMEVDELIDEASMWATRHEELNRVFLSPHNQRAVAALSTGYAIEMLQIQFKGERCWVEFMLQRLPQISRATIYRYIQLAKQYPDPRVLKDAKKLAAFRINGASRQKVPAPETGGKLGTAKEGKQNTSPFSLKRFCKETMALSAMACSGAAWAPSAVLSEDDRKSLRSAVDEAIANLKVFAGKLEILPPLQSLPASTVAHSQSVAPHA